MSRRQFSGVLSMPCSANWSAAMPRSVRPDIEPGTMGREIPNSSANAASIAALPAPPVETSVPSMSNKQARKDPNHERQGGRTGPRIASRGRARESERGARFQTCLDGRYVQQRPASLGQQRLGCPAGATDRDELRLAMREATLEIRLHRL